MTEFSQNPPDEPLYPEDMESLRQQLRHSATERRANPRNGIEEVVARIEMEVADDPLALIRYGTELYRLHQEGLPAVTDPLPDVDNPKPEPVSFLAPASAMARAAMTRMVRLRSEEHAD